jgi:hypothetical protein
MPLTLADLTVQTTDGTGSFDALMRSVKAHLEQEFLKNRIKGPEYSTVYLASLQLAMQTGLTFLLQKDKHDVEVQLLQAQLALVTQQTANAVIEGANLTKQGEMLVVQKALTTQQVANLTAEALNIPKQGAVLDGPTCKLDAEFTLLQSEITKTDQEIALLAQKTATEKAQTQALGVDVDSVIGRQKALYGAQTAGFTRDAEQKVAKLFADVWSVQRTTDETLLPGPAGLDATAIAAVITKLRAGIGA